MAKRHVQDHPRGGRRDCVRHAAGRPRHPPYHNPYDHYDPYAIEAYESGRREYSYSSPSYPQDSDGYEDQ